MALARNLRWSWDLEVVNLFRDLDPIRWRHLGHNPIALLMEFTPDRLELRAAELVLDSRINHAFRRLKKYVTETPLWGYTYAGVLGSKPVAYFSFEFGVHESVPVYSGGLGVLSADHIKSASGLGVPLVAIGLFYAQGHFKQRLDADGWQQEQYVDTKLEGLPMEPALGADGKPISVEIETRTGRLLANVWLVRVGRVDLYLMDCDVEGNSPEDRELTRRLYGGDNRTRIRQELVAGIGGIRALRALGIAPGVYHLNEGHTAFAALEAIRDRMQQDGISFDDALRDVASHTVFTTHTTLPAGHDRFDPALIEEHLGPLGDELGLSPKQLMGFGRVEPKNDREPFCMTILGLKLSQRANAVSAPHGRLTRRMWGHLWPWRAEEEIPIGHITNGVHIPSWLAWQMLALYDRHFPPDWSHRMGEPELWQGIHHVDPDELWETHHALKNLLLAFVRRRVSRQCRRRGESDEVVEAARNMLQPAVLTIGFAGPFATYKRPTLFLSDRDRIAAIVTDPKRPVQFILAGKAHPADHGGKELVKATANLRHDPRFGDRVAFVEDYDINVCRHLIQGVDVWLNNPRQPLEACGTSGQKAALNGALNLSILDGWWAEAYDGSNGFAIGRGGTHVDPSKADVRDAEDLYRTLEEEVIPLYYDRDLDGLPLGWIKRMKNSISSLPWQCSAHRMVAEYTRQCYVPAAKGVASEVRAGSAAGAQPSEIVAGRSSGAVGVPVEIQKSLVRFREDYPDPMKVAFIMMQFGSTKAHDRIVGAIRTALDKHGIAARRADDKWYHDELFWNVMTYVHGCGFAVAVFERIEADDFNPNVSLEVGYIFAIQKPVCLLKDKTLRRLPTDLVGKLYREFDSQDPEATVPKELEGWLADKGII